MRRAALLVLIAAFAPHAVGVVPENSIRPGFAR
jgi:hypothetical protein